MTPSRCAAVAAGLPPPPHEAEAPDCWYVLAEGTLGLAAGDRAFGYDLVYRNSCGGGVLWVTSVYGQFNQSGRNVTFITAGQDGDRSFQGRVFADTLVILGNSDEDLYFARIP